MKSCTTDTARGTVKIHKHQQVIVLTRDPNQHFRGVILSPCACFSLVGYEENGNYRQHRLRNKYLYPIQSPAEAINYMKRFPSPPKSAPKTPPQRQDSVITPQPATGTPRKSLREILNVSSRTYDK